MFCLKEDFVVESEVQGVWLRMLSITEDLRRVWRCILKVSV